MKVLAFFFAFLLVNSIYSQSPCGGGYSFTYSNPASNCIYFFVPVLPQGHPCITSITWAISSVGTYGSECDRRVTDTLGLTYEFCFYGNQNVKMFIRFCDNSVCYVSQTINISCPGAVFCNPDPGNDSIPNPLVEITYIDPENSCGLVSQPKQWCMYEYCPDNSHYCMACGWHWAILIPESPYNCDLFTYRLEYTDVDDCDDGTVTCFPLVPGTIYCIFAKLDEDIIIVADGNSCCLPSGYQRAFIWHPVPCGGGGPGYGIRDPCPGYDYGECIYRCTPLEGDNPCTEPEPIELDQSTSIPTLSCLNGGDKKKSTALTSKKDINAYWSYLNIKNNNFNNLDEKAKTEQLVIIYNVQGVEVFNGVWKFGDPSNLNTNWPKNIGSGLYFVKFQNSKDKKLTRLYKFN